MIGALKRAPGPPRKLPDEILFLDGDLPASKLAEAAARAVELGVGAEEILIAQGAVGEGAYYARLAAHLAADFLDGPVEIDTGADWRAALRTGSVRLADGRWLIAPRGAAIPALMGRVAPELAGARLVIAAPKHFERAIFAQFAGEIAEDGAHHLPRLRPDHSACSGARAAQKWLACALLLLLPAELAFGLYVWAAALLVIALIMCVAVFVRLAATIVALAPAASPEPAPDASLPFYSVIVPLYDEANIVARLVEAMRALDYPAACHEVIYVAEADDAPTSCAFAQCRMPPNHRLVIAPQGFPRTKPRALNIGLLAARGDLLVIYDAEDRPEPDQLRKAVARFRAASPKLTVLQASLCVENVCDSWLTRLFALDYAAQFELLMPGMARLGLPLPLGGTSNHFRTDILREAGGWDAWNVTEDADLGLRLARLGYRCETLPSRTFEEAPPILRDWFLQRRRWLKGWMQTFITHTRHPLRFIAELGFARAMHAIALLAAHTFGPAIGLWITLYVLYQIFAGDFLTARGGLRDAMAWLWAALASFGALSILLPILAAMARARLWTCAPYLLLRPLHWLCVSAAAFSGARELWARPFHWSKTRHGLARKNDGA